MKTRSFKRVLSLLLLILCLTALTSVAYAATDPKLIDLGATGSITVTKYVNTITGSGTPATGLEVSTTPTGYTPLQGAEFTLVQIYGPTDVMNYYNGAETTLTLDEDLLVKDGTGWKYNGTPVDSSKVKTGTTNASGQYVFSGLDVGIYVLKETTAPERITSPYAQTSLISIPMVNTSTSSNNGNAEWMYNVYVYPKNHSAQANVELTKVTENGSPLEGVTFKLYKKECQDEVGNLPGDWTYVTTIQPDDPAGTLITLNPTTNASGKITLNNLPANLYGTRYQLVEVSAPDGYIVNKYPIEFTVKADNTIEWHTGNSAITTYNIEAATETANPKLTMTVRNEKPTLIKQVLENGVADSWKQDTQYQMGDKITYKLTVYVPRNVGELDFFTITDKLNDGLSYYNATANLTVKNSDGMTLGDSSYTRTVALDGKSFTLKFDTSNSSVVANIAGKTLTITYDVYMNGNAVIAGGGNENTASLEYPKQISSGYDTDQYTIKDSTRVYTYDFEITKRKDSNTGAVMSGVQFKLLRAPSDVTGISLIEIATGQYRAPKPGEGGTTEILTTDANGKIYVKGLEKDTYYLKEIVTAQGYNLLSEPFEIDLNIDEHTGWTTSTVYDTGILTHNTYNNTTYELNGTTIVGTKREATIINKQGFVLPQTGGLGFLLFSAAGIVLVAGGALLLFGGRKKKIR